MNWLLPLEIWLGVSVPAAIGAGFVLERARRANAALSKAASESAGAHAMAEARAEVAEASQAETVERALAAEKHLAASMAHVTEGEAMSRYEIVDENNASLDPPYFIVTTPIGAHKITEELGKREGGKSFGARLAE